METAVTTGLTVGAEAVHVLNSLMEEKAIAKSWYGYDSGTFTRWHYWPIPQGSRKIDRVFVISKENWQRVVRKCLEQCHTWHNSRNAGNCSWLYIYRTVSGNGHKNKKDGIFYWRREAVYTEKYQESIASIASISSLPAANLDSWGLIVLALANGADTNFIPTEKGGFAVTFDVRDFVLTLQRDSITVPMTGHIEPRQHPAEQHRLMDETEWFHLWQHGLTYEKNDVLFKWVDKNFVPPQDLVNGQSDDKLKEVVMEDSFRKKFADSLRDTIHECFDLWEKIEEIERDHSWPFKRKNEILQKAKNIQKDILWKKLLLCDFPPWPAGLCFNETQTSADALKYAEHQMRETRGGDNFLKFLSNSGKDPPNGDMDELRKKHEKIVALTRLLTLPKILDRSLSTRDVGVLVALA